MNTFIDLFTLQSPAWQAFIVIVGVVVVAIVVWAGLAFADLLAIGRAR